MSKISKATAPGKVILFGEHAINRGQTAIAASVGLYSTCAVQPAGKFEFRSKGHATECSRAEVLGLGNRVTEYVAEQNFEGIRSLAAADYFAPQKYILGCMFGDDLPEGFSFTWESDVPSSSGLGSGGSAFVAMVAAVSIYLGYTPSLEERADWAHKGDIVAHGGIASALDTQTSLLGGCIKFTGKTFAVNIPVAAGLKLVIAHSGVVAATSEVNSRVRTWLANNPAARIKYFETIGALSAAAETHLEKGNWAELGKLLTLNQLVLQKIGVSSLRIETLIDAALEAGALGAKISGSGGGGIIIALVENSTLEKVRAALENANATVFMPEIGVGGVKIGF